MKYVQRIARNRGALILLDGLDECGEQARRERVLGGVEELTRMLARSAASSSLPGRTPGQTAPSPSRGCTRLPTSTKTRSSSSSARGMRPCSGAGG